MSQAFMTTNELLKGLNRKLGFPAVYVGRDLEVKPKKLLNMLLVKEK